MSTEEQARQGFSIPAQIRECVSLVKERPYVIFADEGVSGETLVRPALERLRKQVRGGLVQTVVCLDPDRLSRKLLNQLILTDEFERHGVEITFVNGDYAKTPEGALFYALRGAISEFEKAKITERMCRGRREKARQGRVLRDFQIYGFDFDPIQERLVVNHCEAEVVRLIFSWFLSPPMGVRGISGIAQFLTEKGVPTKRGAAKWHRQVVRQILENRAYIGEFYQNKWQSSVQGIRLRPKDDWILIPCPAIVNETIFLQVQTRLEKSRKWYAGRESDYLLSGLARCSQCGLGLRGKRISSRGKAAAYYVESQSKGCGLRVLKEDVDSAVWIFFSKLLSSRWPSSHNESTQPVYAGQMKKELEQLQRRKTDLLRELASLTILPEDLSAVLQAFNERERELITVLELSQWQTVGSEDRATENVSQLLQGLSLPAKRELLRLVVKEAQVGQDSVTLITF